MQRRVGLCLGLLAMMVGLVACAPAMPVAGRRQVAVAPGLDASRLPLRRDLVKRQLANGLTYYVLPHHQSANTVSMWLAVNVGSLHEADDQRGAAHFVEHMAFNGTTRFPRTSIVAYLESIGMELGADTAASTGMDETLYKLEVPMQDRANLVRGLDVLREWAGNISFEEAEVVRERGVVLEEWRRGLGLGRRTLAFMARTVLGHLRPATRATIGTEAAIRGMTKATLERFYRDWYQPANMAVIVVGDVDPKGMSQLIEARFASLTARAPRRTPPQLHVGPAPTAAAVHVLHDAESQRPRVTLTQLVAPMEEGTRRAMRWRAAERLVRELMARRFEALAAQPNSPWFEAQLETDGVVYFRGQGSRDIELAVRPGRVHDALALMLTELERAYRHGFAPAERAEVQGQLLQRQQHVAALAHAESSRELAAELTRNFMIGESVTGRAIEYAMAQVDLPSVTAEELRVVLAQWARMPAPQTVMVLPEATAAPTLEAVHALHAQARTAELAPWVHATAVASPWAGKPLNPPGAIVATRQLPSGFVEWKLSNGLTVVVRHLELASQDVLIRAYTPYGSNVADAALFPKVRATSSLVDVGGVGAMKASELQRWLAAEGLALTMDMQRDASAVYVETPAAKAEHGMALLHVAMTDLRRDASQYATWLARTRVALQGEAADASYRLYQAASALWLPNQPRYALMAPDDTARLDYEASLRFFQRVITNRHTHVVIMGNLNLATMRQYVQRYVASIPTTEVPVPVSLDLSLPSKPEAVVMHVEHEPRASVELWFGGKQAWSHERELELDALRQLVELRLHANLREARGGVYSPTVQAGYSSSDLGVFQLRIAFECDPAQKDALVEATLAEIMALQQQGPSEENVRVVRAIRAKEFTQAKASTSALFQWLDAAFVHAVPLPEWLAPIEAMTSVDPATLRIAALRFLDLGRYVRAEALPKLR